MWLGLLIVSFNSYKSLLNLILDISVTERNVLRFSSITGFVCFTPNDFLSFCFIFETIISFIPVQYFIYF